MPRKVLLGHGKRKLLPFPCGHQKTLSGKQKMPHRWSESKQISFRKLHTPLFSKLFFFGGWLRLVALLCVFWFAFFLNQDLL